MKWLRFLTKELPLRVQFWAFLVAWFTWPAALGWVFFRAWANERRQLCFLNPYRVFAPVLLWLPLVLTCGGILFLARQGPIYNRPRSVPWWIVAGLTLVSGAVALLCGYTALDLPGEMRF
jgi:hypothetical protein